MGDQIPRGYAEEKGGRKKIMSAISPVFLVSAFAVLLSMSGCDQAPATDADGPPEPKPAPVAALASERSPDQSAGPERTGAHTTAPLPANGLCIAGEEVIFSCQLENKKLASICGAANKSGKIVAQYRYGKPGESPELLWPETNSKDRLKFASVPYSGGGEAQLHFKRGGHQYVVYSRVIRTNFTVGEPNEPSLEDGIFVRKGEKIIARQSCADSSVMPIDYEKAERYADKSNDGLVEFEY